MERKMIVMRKKGLERRLVGEETGGREGGLHGREGGEGEKGSWEGGREGGS